MTTFDPVQGQVSYGPLLAFASAGTDAVSREHKVTPAPRLPSEPNLNRQFGEKTAEDYTVYLPSRQKQSDPGPIYSNLSSARRGR